MTALFAVKGKIMIHSFQINGEYMAYDIESGSLFFTDRLCYDLLNGGDLSGYSAAEVAEAKKELDSLKSEGCFDACAAEIGPLEKGQEIKSLCLHISHDCNLRCGYCFADEGSYHGKREMMSFEVGKHAVDFLIRNSGKRKNLEMDFFGGEPLMNFAVLQQIVDYAKAEAKKHGKIFKFTTTTNGVLLNREVSDYLNREMDNVVLSLDGRKEVNDAVRKTANGKGSFDLILDNFRYFRSVRGDKSYFVRGTYTAKNPDFAKDVTFLADQGFDQISVEPVVLPKEHPLAIPDDMLGQLCAEYEKLALLYLERRKNPETWFSFFHFNVNPEAGPCLKKCLVGCGAGGEYLAVAPNGEIYPCHQFVGEKDFLMGNVFDGTLRSDIRQKFLETSLLTKPKCKNCWAKYHCSGGCNANAVHYNGDINAPYEPACELMKKRLECALYVYAKERSTNND